MQNGGVFTIHPTEIDDTANLQCAFDEAVAYGEGAKVQLREGNFQIGQIVVNGFHGQFAGAGRDKTLVTNLPNLYVTPIDFYLEAPSADHPWPALFAFVNGDFEISDMAIHISGDNPTMGWSIYGIDPPIIEFALGIGLLGTEINARIDRISLEGVEIEDSFTGYSVINGILFEGNIGEEPAPPNSGSIEVYDSTFKSIAFSTPVLNVTDSMIKVSHNYYENTIYAMDVADAQNSTVEFSHNRVVDAVFGFDLWNYYYPEYVGSTILVKNNIFQSNFGIAFEQTFGDGNECLLLGNNVQNVSEIGIFLGPGTYGCTVVGGSNKTNVLDLGTDNILTGVNNMGTGVGPTIHYFMRP